MMNIFKSPKIHILYILVLIAIIVLFHIPEALGFGIPFANFCIILLAVIATDHLIKWILKD